MAKITRTNSLIKSKDLVTRNAHVQYGSFNIYHLEVITKVNFQKIGRMSRSKGSVTTKRSYHKEYSC